jgi:hypothetical protein
MSFKAKSNIWAAVTALCVGFGLFIPAAAQSAHDEAGFVRIEPVDFFFSFGSYYSRLALRSSPARIWYSFLAADEDGDHKPLFVFFNGGYGSATSSGLMSMNTGRWTMEMDGILPSGRFIPNPNSWTRLGNLIYIDARQTGFSYCLMDNPSDLDARRLEFNAQNFNIYFDAADFIRVLLAFFDSHPQLRRNRVILVGESMGGTRATIMLKILLNYKSFASGGQEYQDPDLVRKLEAHYNLAFPDYYSLYKPPEVVARQFSHVIMIQPAFSLDLQDSMTGQEYAKPGSVIFQLAEEVGKVFTPDKASPLSSLGSAFDFIMDVAGRDLYSYNRPYNNLNDGFAKAADILGNVQNLSLASGTDVTAIPDLYAAARSKAYRVVSEDYYKPSLKFFDPPLAGQLEALGSTLSGFATQAAPSAFAAAASGLSLADVFGVLNPWDRFMLESNGYASYSFWTNVGALHGYLAPSNTWNHGLDFLNNLGYVNTFITNARYDLRVYTPLVPAVLAYYYWIAESAVHDSQPRPGEERGGRIVVTYKSAFKDGSRQRVIRFPLYAQSGHAVTYYEPAAILDDVTAWLAGTGGLSSSDRSGTKPSATPRNGARR